jgi:cytochrome b involved in lipid metabolism
MRAASFICISMLALLVAPMIASATTYDLSTVQQHNTKASCWVIISDKVYDLTSVVVWHAPNIIQCGQDNTAVYLGHHITLNNVNTFYLGDLTVPPPACTYTYSDWGACKSDNTQQRIVLTSLPTDCAGSPVLSQPCTYVPPTCTYTYSAWGTCKSDNTQQRTVLTSLPTGCAGSPAMSQPCTYKAPDCAYTYSDWGTCKSDNTQQRTVLTSLPIGCAGTPVLNQTCTYVPAACTYTYSDWEACKSDNMQLRTVLTSLPTGCLGTPVLSQSCDYQAPACAYTYSDWGACKPDSTQDRTVLTSSPAGCSGTPDTNQPCTYTAPTCEYTYSNWGVCKSDKTQNRTVLTAIPGGCSGSPTLKQNCTPPPVLKKYTMSDVNMHNSNSSCWVAVFKKVYDVTPVIPDYGYFYSCGNDNSEKWSKSIFGNDTSIMAPYTIGTLIDAPINNTIPAANNTPPRGSGNFSTCDLGQHKTRNDCWISISYRVYNISGASLKYRRVLECGKDNTERWRELVYGGNTSRIAKYYAGKIVSKPSCQKETEDDENEHDDGNFSYQQCVDKYGTEILKSEKNQSAKEDANQTEGRRLSNNQSDDRKSVKKNSGEED